MKGKLEIQILHTPLAETVQCQHPEIFLMSKYLESSGLPYFLFWKHKDPITIKDWATESQNTYAKLNVL